MSINFLPTVTPQVLRVFLHHLLSIEALYISIYIILDCRDCREGHWYVSSGLPFPKKHERLLTKLQAENSPSTV